MKRRRVKGNGMLFDGTRFSVLRALEMISNRPHGPKVFS
jgi:hypothetical protein